MWSSIAVAPGTANAATIAASCAAHEPTVPERLTVDLGVAETAWRERRGVPSPRASPR
jgi:hypothetical protein